MARALRIALGCLAALLLLAAAALWGLHRAVQHVPPRYQQALFVDPADVEQQVLDLESRAGALYSDTQEAGLEWSASFSADQINAWLASAFEAELGDKLADSMEQPRIHIAPDGITLGFRTERAGVETVVTVQLDLFLTEVNEIALRIADVRAGRIPIPAQPFIDDLVGEARRHEWPIRWTQQEGDPVALLAIPNELERKGRGVRLDSIQLLDGEIYIAGRTLGGSDGEAGAEAATDDDSSPEDASLREWHRVFDISDEEKLTHRDKANRHAQDVDADDGAEILGEQRWRASTPPEEPAAEDDKVDAGP